MMNGVMKGLEQFGTEDKSGRVRIAEQWHWFGDGSLPRATGPRGIEVRTAVENTGSELRRRDGGRRRRQAGRGRPDDLLHRALRGDGNLCDQRRGQGRGRRARDVRTDGFLTVGPNLVPVVDKKLTFEITQPFRRTGVRCGPANLCAAAIARSYRRLEAGIVLSVMDETLTRDHDSILEAARRALGDEAEAIRAAAARLNGEILRAVDLILTSRGRLIVSGMGKSGLVGRKISATLSSTGTPSFFLHPAEARHGDLGMVKQGVLLLLSNPGRPANRAADSLLPDQTASSPRGKCHLDHGENGRRGARCLRFPRHVRESGAHQFDDRRHGDGRRPRHRPYRGARVPRKGFAYLHPRASGEGS